MATYFKTTARNYSDVSVTADGIDTDQFLQATEGLVKIFGMMQCRSSKLECSSSLFACSFQEFRTQASNADITPLPIKHHTIHGIDLFGNVFTVVQSDMNGNIKVWDGLDTRQRMTRM